MLLGRRCGCRICCRGGVGDIRLDGIPGVHGHLRFCRWIVRVRMDDGAGRAGRRDHNHRQTRSRELIKGDTSFMDPIQVMKTVWRHRLMALPVILLTVVAVVYVAKWGPRSYESTASYVLISPRAPSAAEVLKDPSLGNVGADNPYLRTTSDPALAAQVVISTMNSERTARALADQGIPPEYSALPGSGSGGSSIITFTATAGTAEQSLQAMEFLGTQLVDILKDVQTANGADERYLISAIEVDASENAVEKVSSRLRTVVV